MSGALVGIGAFLVILGWQILNELYKITDLLHDIAGAARIYTGEDRRR